MIYSDDRGVTWNASTPIPLGVASLNNECQLSLGGSASGDSSGNYKVRYTCVMCRNATQPGDPLACRCTRSFEERPRTRASHTICCHRLQMAA